MNSLVPREQSSAPAARTWCSTRGTFSPALRQTASIRQQTICRQSSSYGGVTGNKLIQRISNKIFRLFGLIQNAKKLQKLLTVSLTIVKI